METIFLADNIAIAEYRATYVPQTQFDPISVLSALAAGTDHVGLIGTGSTTDGKPWELARRFATLDHLSAGRAGWNIVTTVTPLATANLGEAAHPGQADRYARAREFVEVVERVWDSWGDDVIVGDRARGVWANRNKLRAPRFHGSYFDAEGVQPFPRSPQGHPVRVLAGQSTAGIELAARCAAAVPIAGRGVAVDARRSALCRRTGTTRGVSARHRAERERRRGRNALHRNTGAVGRARDRLAGCRRSGRIHHHGVDTAARVGHLRRPRRADPATPGPIPHRVHRDDVAQSPWSVATARLDPGRLDDPPAPA